MRSSEIWRLVLVLPSLAAAACVNSSTVSDGYVTAPKVFGKVGPGTGASVISAAIDAATGASPAEGAPSAAPPRGGWNVVAIAKDLLSVLAAGQGEEDGLQAGLELGRVADVQSLGRPLRDHLAEQALGLGGKDTQLVALGLYGVSVTKDAGTLWASFACQVCVTNTGFGGHPGPRHQ